jgi:hypothetical protein
MEEIDLALPDELHPGYLFWRNAGCGAGRLGDDTA